ncbi:chaperone NapD [Minwuia thermotolerans]|uniref:Chaperone NapD n=1 Tax=Minwuia thermotolerans TaxID=2056226 RepID=A0A2M9FYL8_9PROT|nr:chaperone NapD [Minwuia thermotolerans]PJK28550.1 glutamate synthase [Minwuia thermotolerans]
MNSSVHIASLVVQCRPEKLGQVQTAIAAEPGTEIHAADPAGKLVVVVETATEGAITDLSFRLGHTDGVLSCNLVYHAVDDGEAAPFQGSSA